MAVKGFQGTSLLDFPGKIASLIFFGGCNLTCPFCHNPSLVLDPDQYPDYPWEALDEELQQRASFIDGVVVSGGEPTLDSELLPFLRRVKGFGLQVKLDTNGLSPKLVRQARAEDLLDFIALDLKTSPFRYQELHDGPVNRAALTDTVQLLLEGGVDYEIRTTCVPGFVEQDDIHAMGSLVQGAETWVLQQFVPDYALADTCRELEPHSPQVLKEFVQLAEGYVKRVHLRGL